MSRESTRKLLFVYNADSGLGNNLLDAAHKILNPATYDCRLCELTYGAFREKRSWKAFREQSEATMEFLHKDEFLKTYSSKFLPAYSFPIVLEVTAHDMEVFLGTEELNALNHTDDLIRKVKVRLSKPE
ncbi:GTPase [Muriicola marianensis]|uniref:GTPase n=1 Tax=Muriicola marianensis TaxID=1324801 RepID=UPI001E51B7E8|nr:GTPase [Muriicola marianensis]